MYIYETTAEERMTIDSAVGDMFSNIELAQNLLWALWEENFSKAKPESISACEAGFIGNTLLMINNTIFDALLAYALTVGRSDFPGVQAYLEGARRAQTILDCEAVKDKVIDLRRHTSEMAALNNARDAIMKLPDEQAIPAFKELLKGANKCD